MFRRTSPQQSLLHSRFLVPPAKRARLEKSWAHGFREGILPLIDEELFREDFHAWNGRPNQSIRMTMSLEILKHWHDWTDEQVLEALEYNLQWQYALDVTADDAHLPQKTLHNHRVRLLANDRARQMFESVTRRLVEVDGLSVSRQRLDSTHVMSNIAVLTRLGLMVETMTVFLRALAKAAPEKLAGLGRRFAERYLEREGYFADAKREQAQRRLPAVARDFHEVVVAFTEDEQVAAMESFGLVVRVFEEQCEVLPPDPDIEGGGTASAGASRFRLKEGKEISGQSLQSPHDPDATYGHKGKGYEVQVAETCVEENPYQVVTHVAVGGAHESDQHATPRVIEALQANELAPEELLADTGYGSGENIVAAAQAGIDLAAPVQDPTRPKGRDTFLDPAPPPADAASTEAPQPLDLADFRFSPTFDEVLACPGGHAPIANETAPGPRKPHTATFDGATCADCPLRELCPTRQPRGAPDRVLPWRPPAAATAARQREQRGKAFKDRYRLRSGIESTNAELKGRHGADDLRVRGMPRVTAAMQIKALALNVKRACHHYVEAAVLPVPSPA